MSESLIWQVFNNPGFGYFVARVINPNEPEHGGNLKRLDEQFYSSKVTAQLAADKANKMG